MNKEKIKKFVSKYAPKKWYYYYNFDGIKVRPDLKKRADCGLNNWKKISPIIYNLLNQYKNPKVLDIGCNMGLYCFEMQKHGANTIGIDKDIKQALFFQKYINENKNIAFKCKLIKKDVTKEVFSVNRVDIITMFCVIYHLYPFHDFVLENLPAHSCIVVQGNKRRLVSKKRKKYKGRHLANIQGIVSLLNKHDYKCKVYLKNYIKPIIVGMKKESLKSHYVRTKKHHTSEIKYREFKNFINEYL